jgi:hypothetical protein
VSTENVELVRRNIGTMQLALNAYWRDPRSIVAALDADELWPKCYVEMAVAWTDFLKRVEGFTVRIEEYTARDDALDAAAGVL